MKHQYKVTFMILSVAAILFLMSPASVFAETRKASGADTAGDTAASSKKKAVSKKKRKKKYTKYNGVDLSEIYDFDYYVKHNKYAKKHFKNKPKEAIKYFGRYAIRRGTRARAKYSKKTYRKLYRETHPYPQADKILDKVGWKLKPAFTYSAFHRAYHGPELREWSRPYKRTSMWYFNFLKNNRRGNCYSKAGMFTILATEMGYDITQIGGLIPHSNGVRGPHSWVEITIKGKTYVCDPSYYSQRGIGYMFRYGTKGTYRYESPHRMKKD
ncbi:MAG: transglutaminase domain-containing protein [Lachnospiraceae bacterium]|nr:transglutaminase domain-containing protein [Lachnospiraceae bacterium]